jgi:hypothetical protein
MAPCFCSATVLVVIGSASLRGTNTGSSYVISERNGTGTRAFAKLMCCKEARQ